MKVKSKENLSKIKQPLTEKRGIIIVSRFHLMKFLIFAHFFQILTKYVGSLSITIMVLIDCT